MFRVSHRRPMARHLPVSTPPPTTRDYYYNRRSSSEPRRSCEWLLLALRLTTLLAPLPRFFFAPPLLLLVVMGSVAGRTRPFGLTDCHGECRGPLHWDQKKKRGCSVAYRRGGPRSRSSVLWPHSALRPPPRSVSRQLAWVRSRLPLQYIKSS